MTPHSFYAAGQPAAWISLASVPGKTVRRRTCAASRRLVFYPADWSPVCGDQLALYNEIYSEFTRLGATLIGISVDSIWCHAAYSKSRNLEFPLLADFEPKGAVARRYGAYTAPPTAPPSGCVRHRPGRRDPLELPVADRREPGRPRGSSRCWSRCGRRKERSHAT